VVPGVEVVAPGVEDCPARRRKRARARPTTGSNRERHRDHHQRQRSWKELNAISTIASIDGGPVADVDGYWSAPEPVWSDLWGAIVWATYWTYPTGITVAAGDSITISYEWALSHQLVDGLVKIDDTNKLMHFTGPYSFSCTITAS
jgi:hypothetical protein